MSNICNTLSININNSNYDNSSILMNKYFNNSSLSIDILCPIHIFNILQSTYTPQSIYTLQTTYTPQATYTPQTTYTPQIINVDNEQKLIIDVFKYYCMIEINKINDNKDKNKNYKILYTDNYYLDMIIKMLDNNNKWSNLKNDKEYVNKSIYHYKTIYNKFIFWCNKDIFKNAMHSFNLYYSNKNPTNLLIVDASINNNLYGEDNIGINPQNKKHKGTKNSTIIDKNKFILSIIIGDTYLHKTKNGRYYKTLASDIKAIDIHLQDLEYINNKSKYFTILGDKGYKTYNTFKINDKVVHLISPDKKNAKKENLNNKSQNIKLSKHRSKIEHVFSSIKRNSRICVRKDRRKSTYMNFMYIASFMHNIKIYKNSLKNELNINNFI